MMLTAGVLAGLSFTHHITKTSLLALTFALGLGTATNYPAWQAIQPELVPEAEYGQAVALGSLTYNVGRAVGPALGGLLVAAAGPGWVFALNAASFVGTVVVLWRWHPATLKPRLPAESLASATRAALRYGANAPILRGVLIRTGVLILPATAAQALLPIDARGPLGLGSGGYGVLLGCFGAGAIIAAVFRPRIVATFSPDQVLQSATLVLAAALVVEGSVRTPWLVGVALSFAGAAWTSATISTNVAAVSVLPMWVRARGMGLYMLVLAGSLAIGSAAWGGLANWHLRGAHLTAAVCLLLGLGPGRRWKLARTADVDVRTMPGSDPLVNLSPAPTDGPVLVTVAYRVAHDEMTEFTEAMRRVERHRRRTGAHRWGLFRDVAEPDLFLETFLVGSWVEHLRQHGRDTRDGDVSRVRRYRADDYAPGHHISAYSAGALEPLVPHLEPSESTTD